MPPACPPPLPEHVPAGLIRGHLAGRVQEPVSASALTSAAGPLILGSIRLCFPLCFLSSFRARQIPR